MIIIKRDNVISWLKVLGRDQQWLAKELGTTKGYVSRILWNKCKISNPVIEYFLMKGFDFNSLFYFNGEKDNREYQNPSACFDGKMKFTENRKYTHR